MKAKLVNYRESLYLLKRNGEILLIAPGAAREFLINFNDEEYCGADNNPLPYAMSDFEGVTIAEVDNSGQLIVKDAEAYRDIIIKGETDFISVPEFAQLNGKCASIVRRMCQAGKIPGVKQVGNVYLIPAGTPYPNR